MTEIISQGGSKRSQSNSQHPELLQSIHQMRQDLNWYYHRIEIEQFGPEAGSASRVDRLRKKANSLKRNLRALFCELPPSLQGTRQRNKHRCNTLLQRSRKAWGMTAQSWNIFR